MTVVYQPLLKAPSQDIYVPRRYDGLIQHFADGLELSRSAAVADRTPIRESQLGSAFDASRGLLRISVDRIGADLATAVTSVVKTHAAGLVHVDLPMNDPAINDAVEGLRRASFAFAAWLPGWASTTSSGLNT